MVSCKVAPHIRRLGASLLHRGFCHTVDAGESSSLSLLRLLEKSVEASGKQLVSLLRRRIQEEEQAAKEKERHLENLVEAKERLVEAKERLVEVMEMRLQKELELRAKDTIELLRARGLNDARGLFKLLQERLAAQAVNVTAQIKGADLWEAILASNAGLAACIERCTNVRAANTSKQAMHCYNVYSVLSQHVHDGKHLADLQAHQRGAIEFQRGPLSPEQVEILVCLGSAAGVKLVEDKIF